MADGDEDTIEEIFALELERLQAAMNELESAPPEEPETIADAFEIGTNEPESPVSSPTEMDSLLLSTPPGPPSAPQMDAQPPGPPATAPRQPAYSPPAGACGSPPGPPPSSPPGAAAGGLGGSASMGGADGGPGGEAGGPGGKASIGGADGGPGGEAG
ncbi:MAG: hypothetical protein VYA86_07025, partial [Candidatus Thermoplasmatota archaeon]|nr:hypothetical protein [Candidatus Thermoplasmatota archaeon]